MTKRIEEYETLIQKYNALQRLIDEEFLEAIDELDSAISHMESTTNYIRAQKSSVQKSIAGYMNMVTCMNLTKSALVV